MSESKKDRKRGFWAYISGLFKGSSPAARGGLGSLSGAGGAPALGGASGLGSAGSGLGGLFATKAGIMGIVLGGATLAAGIGVIYNFIGPSAKPVYTPQLFQNAYYDEQAQSASADRAARKNSAAADVSTLDMFREQAKKDGLLLGDDAQAADKKGASDAPADETPADNAAARPAPESASGVSGGPRLQGAAGFGARGAAGGGTSTNIPQLSGGGGLFGGIGSQFSPVYRPPTGQGQLSAMKGSVASVMKNSPKYAVPGFNKKGAYSQAKFAGKMGNRAAYSTGETAARTTAAEAFSGETAGTGDVGTVNTGAGLGAGLSTGNKLKTSDPTLNSENYTPPKVPPPTGESPWDKLTNKAMDNVLLSFGMILLAKILGKIKHPIAMYAAMAAAAAAMYFALQVILAGLAIMKGDLNGIPPWAGQKWQGLMWIMAGAVLMIQAWNALVGLGSVSNPVTGADGVTKMVTMPNKLAPGILQKLAMNGALINLGGML